MQYILFSAAMESFIYNCGDLDCLRLLQEESPSYISDMFMYFANKNIFFLYNSVPQLISQIVYGPILYVIFKKSLNKNSSCLLTAEGLVVKTEMKDCRKLTTETWSQNLGRMTNLGLRSRQGMLTICCFSIFQIYFYQSNLKPNTANFQQY